MLKRSKKPVPKPFAKVPLLDLAVTQPNNLDIRISILYIIDILGQAAAALAWDWPRSAMG